MHQGPQTYVTKQGANHTLHLILSILTCGVWAVTGWPIAALLGRRTKTTAYGRTQQTIVYPPPQGYYPPPPQQPRYGPPGGWQQPQQPGPPPGQYGPPPQ